MLTASPIFVMSKKQLIANTKSRNSFVIDSFGKLKFSSSQPTLSYRVGVKRQSLIVHPASHTPSPPFAPRSGCPT